MSPSLAAGMRDCAPRSARANGARASSCWRRAPRAFRGGNSRHTRNLRCMHDAPTDLLSDSYSEEEYLADLIRVTGGQTSEPLARIVVRESAACPAWIRKFGGRLQPPLRGTLHLGRTNAFFLGGGKALMNTYYAAAERLGVRIVYDAEVVGTRYRRWPVPGGGRTTAAAGSHTVRAGAVILAAGGFESNLDWLKEIWGDAADNFIIRGTPYNTGTVLKQMLTCGAQPVGDPTAVPRDRRRCARTEVRRRDRDQARLGAARDRGQQARRALLRRRRGLLAEAVRDLGTARSLSSRIRSPIRLSTPRSPGSSCRRCFRRWRPLPSASSPRC